jgi:signal transduction histidine kinase
MPEKLSASSPDVGGGSVIRPTRLLRLVVPSTRRGAGLAILAAAIFFVLETVLVILLKQVDPVDPVGVVYAAFLGAALLANFVAGVVATRQVVLALNASRARIVAAADAARRQVERDLHDGAQQRLIALGLKLRAAQAAVAADQIALKTELSEAISDLLEVSHELQEISRGIHPAILSQGGLAPALDTLAIRSPVPVDLDLAINQPLSDLVEVAAYYVVAEALTNAAKHAHASQVTVSAKTHDHTLILSIDDDGIGGADSGKQGSGLIGLKDRVEVLGGQMHISSPPGSGTFLNVTIPLHSEKTLDSAAPESSSSGDNVGGAGIRG